MGLFSDSGDKCPMEPHDEKAEISSKPIEKKVVADLRKNMEKGVSTQVWVQEGEDFKDGENTTGKNLKPEFSEQPIRIGDLRMPLTVAAHHIIPGKASLPKSTVRKYIWKSEGTIKGDIGYDVDGAENGIWLPTHHAASSKMNPEKDGDGQIRIGEQGVLVNDDDAPEDSYAMSWSALSNKAKKYKGDDPNFAELFVPRYTQQAMKLLSRQFHDAHPKYNDWVKERLDRLAAQVESLSLGCSECQKSKEKSPPYALVFRLNALSGTISGALLGSPRKSWGKVFTSVYAKKAASKPVPNEKLYGS